jgi:uncharacterized protein
VAVRLVLVAMLLCAGCGAPAPGPAGPVDVTGSWTGRLELPGAPLDVGVTLAGTPEARTGALDVPAQGIAGMPLAGVTVDGGTVRFTVPGLPGDASFAGTVAADGATIGGSFTQGGGSLPLVLRRGTVAAQDRPQEPARPSPTGPTT